MHLKSALHVFAIGVCLISLPPPVHAQVKTSKGVEYKVGSPFPVVDAQDKNYFLTKNNEVISLKLNPGSIIIQRFGVEDLKQRSRKEYKDMPKDYVIESMVMIADRLHVLYSVWDGDAEMEQLFTREVDVSSGSFQDKGRLLHSVKGRLSGTLAATGFYKFAVTDKFKTQLSMDGDKLLVYWRMKPKEKDDDLNNDVFGMKLLDPAMGTIWDVPSVKMPYTEAQMDVYDWALDAEGRIFLLAAVKEDMPAGEKKDKKAKKEGDIYRFELIRFVKGTGEFEVSPMEIGAKFIASVGLFENPAGGLICAGYYASERWTNKVDGIFMSKVDANGVQSDKVSHEIPLEVITQNAKAAEQRKAAKDEEDGDAGFGHLKLREMYVEDDGSVMLIGEKHYVKTHTYTSNGRTQTRYTYHYEDILATRIDANGNLAWMRRLPKRQEGSNGRGGMGYEVLSGGGKYTMFYLDNVKNMDIKDSEVPERHSDGAGGYLTAYQLDDAGTVTKLSVFDSREVKTGMSVHQFMTDRIVRAGDDEFIVELYKKDKQDVLIRVKLTGVSD